MVSSPSKCSVFMYVICLRICFPLCLYFWHLISMKHKGSFHHSLCFHRRIYFVYWQFLRNSTLLTVTSDFLPSNSASNCFIFCCLLPSQISWIYLKFRPRCDIQRPVINEPRFHVATSELKRTDLTGFYFSPVESVNVRQCLFS